MMAMSANERLFEAGLISSFDDAVSTKDSARLREILRMVYVDEGSIRLTLQQYGIES
jgi:hypothetical protein